MRIALAVLSILLIAGIFQLWKAGPDFNHRYAEFSCGGHDAPVEATFPDMAACSAQMSRDARYCACSRPENPLAYAFFFGFVPLATALAATVLLRGTFAQRLLQFCVSMILAVFGFQQIVRMTE